MTDPTETATEPATAETTATEPEAAASTGPVQNAEATGRARVTQVGGDYEENHYRYVRGWEYLRGVRVDDHEVNLVENAFVDTPGLNGSGQVENAVRLLNPLHGQSHVLVLIGEPGTGRRTAALRVLRDVGVPRDRIRWLVLDWERARTEQIPHTKRHGFVLDLTNSPAAPEDFYTGLADYQKEAEAADAYLIILATAGAWAPGAVATVPTVRLARPSAKKIAEAHLRHLAANRLDWLTSAPLDALLATAAHASDAARLARLVAKATGDDRNAVEQEFTDWEQHLRDWFEEFSGEGDLRERALLVSAALLEGVPAGVVLEAADQLFAEVGGALPAGKALAGRDLDARLEAIRASSVNGENISLDDDRHGLAGAVLRHVWQQRPQLRKALLEWASHISAPNGIAVHHLRRIATSLAQLSLLTGGATVLSVASGWIDTGRAAHRQLAVEIMETMALDPIAGPGVRKQLYDWASQKNTSDALATSVAEICAGRLGEMYPRVALTRLRLLASRTDERGREAVADAVRTLAGAAEQRALVLSEIVEWSESANATIRKAGASTFLALTDVTSEQLLPLPVVEKAADGSAGAPVGELFVRGWRAALLEPTAAETAHVNLAAWLDSPHLADDQVLSLAAAVLRGIIGREGTAKLLVGNPDSSEVGRARRRLLLDQLISEQSHSPAARDPEPNNGSAFTTT
ncbi:hypothetical protein [Streptomyces sp. NPDC088360]|uniref:hypothetical protein n=1 Tax=Streptomyces sp. NPDC088360 TaxID=3154515 RepID=UPI00344B9353